MKKAIYALIAAALLPVWAQESLDVTRLMQDTAVKAALEAAKANEPAIIEEQIRLSEIPAPEFKEEKERRLSNRFSRTWA